MYQSEIAPREYVVDSLFEEIYVVNECLESVDGSSVSSSASSTLVSSLRFGSSMAQATSIALPHGGCQWACR